ncbi:MAG TPA: TonB-dependent receptor [Caulobacteraceae bacterium]|nr:TonB-dependent receptor [Caulobacteraceae bacterium]
MLNTNLRTTLMAGVSTLLIASAAHAQSQPQPASNEIVVTGSRVIKNGANSPTPLTTVATEQLQTIAPTSLVDALNDLPTFSGSRNQFSNPGSSATGVQGGNGAADVLNLRNLGAYRTLILYDGHRVPPSLFNSTTDVDIIPQELISRVDIVTGGVSAVYGSDAVSGVVNFVANRNFNGFKAHAQYGLSQYGDSQNYDIGGAYGTRFDGGKGHVEFSYDYRDNDGILFRSSRPWDDLPAVGGGGTAANPYQLYTNVHLAAYTFGGLITSKAAGAGYMFGDNGAFSKFVSGAATGNNAIQVGGSGAYNNASMESPSNQHQVFGRADYDFTDTLHGFVVASANLKTNLAYPGYLQLTNVTLNGANPYLTAAEQTALGAGNFTLSEMMQNAPRSEVLSHSQQYYVNAGLEGKIADYAWNLTYTHGASELQTSSENNINYQNLYAALDATTNSSGQIVCRAAIANPTVYGNCVPLDVFGPSAASAAAVSYVTGTVTMHSSTVMDAVDGSFSGSVFNAPAGPVTAAVSGEWRKLSYDISSNGTPTQYVNCASYGYANPNCAAAPNAAAITLWGTTFPYSPTVSQSVWETAFETDIPLVKDAPLIKSFNLNGAVRYTDYSTSGSYLTWKVGAVWNVTDEFKLRATTSHDIRAPTLYDLFQAVSVVNGNFTDTINPSKPTTSYVPSINVGNPNLKAEDGYTTTLGLVWRPSLLPGATLSVDTYHTDILNAITTIQGFNAQTQSICYGSGGASPFCSLIQRAYGAASPTNAAAAATAYYIKPFNIGKLWTYGADVEAGYTHTVFGRRADVRVLMNYQPHIYYEQPGSVVVDQGDAGWGSNGLIPSPSFQLTALVGYQVTDAFRFDVSERYRNALHRSGVLTQIWADPIVPAYATTGLTFTYDLKDRAYVPDTQMFFNIDNLFNATPPLEGYYSGGTSAGAAYEFSDNPVGRAFMIGVRIRG